MSEAHLDTVLAGTKGFALALFVPLTERVGIRPRVATDATQALTLVESPRGLVVVEVEGEGTVRSIRELLATRKDLAVVAAVPDAHAAQQDALRALGVELARWDGTPAAVLGAVSKTLGATAAPAASPPPPAAKPEATAPAPVAPRVTPPATAAVPAAPPPAPAFFSDLQPAKPRPALELEDELDVVSIEDLGPAVTPAPVAPPLAPAVPAPPAPVAEPSPAAGGSSWPGGGISAADAEAALARGITGSFEGDSKLRTVTEGVVASLSALEVAVLGGDPVAIDPGPLRRAAVMRLRVAHALAKRPPPGSGVDQAALSTMLGEIDALLSEVSALSQGAPAELQPSLATIRNALVKEAIDFSEAAQELAPSGVPAVVEAPAAPVQRRVPATRVLNVSAKPEPVARPGSRALWVVLVLAALGAGGFHGWRMLEARKAIAPPSTVAGAPQGAVGAATAVGTKTIMSKDGKPFTDAEIETFRQREELQGRKVQLVTPFMLVSFPASGPAAPALPQPPPQPQPQGAKP